jgi:hypothetical protein
MPAEIESAPHPEGASIELLSTRQHDVLSIFCLFSLALEMFGKLSNIFIFTQHYA